MEIPNAIEKNPTYENFEVRCPICKHWNIFNRASELKTFNLICEQIVVCQNKQCQKEFLIGGDLINPAWQMLILDCELLKQQKRYSYCVLNLAQAFEMYFSLFFRVHFIYKPYGIEKSYESNRFADLSKMLFKTTRRLTYRKLRNIFMNILIEKIKCTNLEESKNVINNFKDYFKDPTDKSLVDIHDQELNEVLLKLKNCKVSTLRNNVVHKYAYRPNLEEVEMAIEETIFILNRLDKCLGVLSDHPYIYEVLL
jgi:hypothetical protein